MKEKKFFSALHLKTAYYNQLFVLVFWLIVELVTSQLSQYSNKYYDTVGESALFESIISNPIHVSISSYQFKIYPVFIIIVLVLIKILNIFFGIRNSDYGHKVDTKITDYNYFLTIFDMINVLVFTAYILVRSMSIEHWFTRFYYINPIALLLPLFLVILNTLWFTAIIFVEGKKQKNKD